MIGQIFEIASLNMSYQFCRRLLFITFLWGSSLLLFASCRPAENKKNISARAETYFISGEFAKLDSLAEVALQSGEISEKERLTIDSLREIGRRIRLDFKLTGSEVRGRLEKYFPGLDSAMISRWEENRKLEMRLIDGERRYFKNAVSNLFRLDDEARKHKIRVDGALVDSLDLFRPGYTARVIGQTQTSGETVLPVRMRLNYSVSVKPNAVPAGEIIRCWMPFPREGHARQTNISLLKSDPENALIAPEESLQRTVYLEKKAEKDMPTTFRIEFEVETASQYFDLNPDDIKPYDSGSAVYCEYTAERTPQILFTPTIRRLGDSIVAGETNPLLKVQKIYNWINSSVRWASALEYGTMGDIPGYVLQNHHGDCGMQTLLFMTLARSQGIPVKWQSGWMLYPRNVNLHDWCEVYYEGVGWVPLDQSFGLQNSDDEKVRNFYRSGIDSYRLIVNDDYSRKLFPEKKYLRSEPYDFQRGELEWEGGNLYFDQWSWNMEVEYQ